MTSQTLSVAELLVSKKFAVVLDSKGTHLVTASINANGLTVLETALSSLFPNAVGLPELLSIKLDGAISLALGDVTAILLSILQVANLMRWRHLWEQLL